MIKCILYRDIEQWSRLAKDPWIENLDPEKPTFVLPPEEPEDIYDCTAGEDDENYVTAARMNTMNFRKATRRSQIY